METLSNTAHVYRKEGEKAVAKFMTIHSEDLRSLAEKQMERIANWALKMPNLLKASPERDAKVAVVLMMGVKHE